MSVARFNFVTSSNTATTIFLLTKIYASHALSRCKMNHEHFKEPLALVQAVLAKHGLEVSSNYLT